ncbi:Uncharacterised protein [Chlamydia trachomatis]|nr:Uncharacterised protein [Chlamydia trachomatis]
MSTHTKKLRRRHRKQARWMFPILLSVAGLISASLFNPWNVASAFDFFSNASSSQPPAGTSQPSSNTALSAGTPPSIDLSDIPGPFYGGLNVNSPLLEVGKYASLQVNATNAAGAEVSATSDEAQHFSGKLTLDIPVSEMLKATKEAMERDYKDETAKLDFSYSISLPEPLSWENTASVDKQSSLVTSARANISKRHTNTITLNMKFKEAAWKELYGSTDTNTVKLTAHVSFTKSQLEQVKNKNITGTGILNLQENDHGTWVPGFGGTYITHELTMPLLGGQASITSPLDVTKNNYHQLIHSDSLTADSKNTSIPAIGKFTFSSTAQKVVYEDYSAPLLTRDGLEINSKISTAPFKSSLTSIENWLKTNINDVSRVYISGLNLSIKLTFTLPQEISLSPSRELPDEPHKHYPMKIGGVRNDPTSLLGSFDGFELKDVQEKGNVITATASLKDWYRGNELMRPYAYSYDEIKERINALADELTIKFIPVWFNTDAQAGKTYQIEGSAQGTLSGKMNYVYRQLGGNDTDKLIPFNISFGEEKIEVPAEVPYDITFKFISGTPSQTLPDYISKQYALKPINVYNGKSFTIDTASLRTTDDAPFEPYPEVVGDGTKQTGTWVFDSAAGWKVDGKGEAVTTIGNVNKNLTLVGTWKFIPVTHHNTTPSPNLPDHQTHDTNPHPKELVIPNDKHAPQKHKSLSAQILTELPYESTNENASHTGTHAPSVDKPHSRLTITALPTTGDQSLCAILLATLVLSSSACAIYAAVHAQKEVLRKASKQPKR